MYLDKISLKDIRGFENLEFSLKRPDGSYAGWTVFTGENGSGKSTLLKAIAVGLVGSELRFFLEPNLERWIRSTAAKGSIELGVVYGPSHGILTVLIDGTSVETFAPSFPVRWFCCGYGPFRRVFGASPEAARFMTAPATERFVTLFQEAASLGEVDQWLRSLSHKSLEGKKEDALVLKQLLEILGDELMPNGVKIDRVDSDGLWLLDRNGVQLAWSDMSDGYRSALALLVDIVRHLINAFGVKGLTKRDENGRLYITPSGVVLIDEIDAHLHPEWQREIGFWLKRHFPNIQFLVTTHSPIICQAADPNGLFVLPEPGSGDAPRALTSEEYNEVIASRPDTILRSAAFGLRNTRSPVAVEARAVHSQLMSKKRSGAKLTAAEKKKLGQTELFAAAEEEL